ncbi:MAG: hypothetical protein JSU73_07090 [candidate division WOR-3 bacterium]|nr:MAG: hypothetical protein JSU73_07090 [candidate division WOR-3 bacterium]
MSEAISTTNYETFSTRDRVALATHSRSYGAIGNILRAGISGLGRPSGTVQHWNPKTFRVLLDRHVEVQDMPTVFPWVIARCRERR